MVAQMKLEDMIIKERMEELRKEKAEADIPVLADPVKSYEEMTDKELAQEMQKLRRLAYNDKYRRHDEIMAKHHELVVQYKARRDKRARAYTKAHADAWVVASSGSFQNWKERVKKIALSDESRANKLQALKKEYGTGGGTLCDELWYSMGMHDHNAKGVQVRIFLTRPWGEEDVKKFTYSYRDLLDMFTEHFTQHKLPI